VVEEAVEEVEVEAVDRRDCRCCLGRSYQKVAIEKLALSLAVHPEI
jgi:hypothetical protein